MEALSNLLAVYSFFFSSKLVIVIYLYEYHDGIMAALRTSSTSCGCTPPCALDPVPEHYRLFTGVRARARAPPAETRWSANADPCRPDGYDGKPAGVGQPLLTCPSLASDEQNKPDGFGGTMVVRCPVYFARRLAWLATNGRSRAFCSSRAGGFPVRSDCTSQCRTCTA